MLDEETLAHLSEKARGIRASIVRMVTTAQSGHVGGSLSAADILVALYYHLMRHNPALPNWPERDRFILSKGHCTPVIYAVLADCGYFPESDLATFRRPGSHLQGHPYSLKTPGIEASTGTLGLGLSTAVGMALAAKLKAETHWYFVLCGDGELQEGQIWEAAMFANKYKLANVIAFIDRNYLQTDGNSEDIMPLDPLRAKWEAFGWATFEIDGHNFQQIADAVESAKGIPDAPKVIIAKTVKGKGVSFMENENKWHGTPPTGEECARALEELSRGI
jgi:transketolase